MESPVTVPSIQHPPGKRLGPCVRVLSQKRPFRRLSQAVANYRNRIPTMTPNARGAGKGGTAVLWRAGRAWPALPDRERSL
jgi:hypothetical protein